MASPQVCKIFIWYAQLGPPECNDTTLLPARPVQGREAREGLAWALGWLLGFLSSFEGRMPVAGPGCQVPAGQLCGLPPAGVPLQVWIPTLDIHPHSGYSCNRSPPTMDREYELSDRLGDCGSKARWAGGVMKYIFTFHEIYPRSEKEGEYTEFMPHFLCGSVNAGTFNISSIVYGKEIM